MMQAMELGDDGDAAGEDGQPETRTRATGGAWTSAWARWSSMLEAREPFSEFVGPALALLYYARDVLLMVLAC